MKTPIPVSAMVAGAASAPIVSAQKKSAPGRAAMSMGMGMNKQISRTQEHMKEMQQQMK